MSRNHHGSPLKCGTHQSASPTKTSTKSQNPKLERTDAESSVLVRVVEGTTDIQLYIEGNMVRCF